MTVTVYIARDMNGELYLYSSKPVLREDGTFLGTSFVSNKEVFKDIKKGECKTGSIIYKEDK